MATVQSIIDRVTFITRDADRVRWTEPEMLMWINDAQDQIASVHPRAAAQHRYLTLTAGARQDLRVIDPSIRWLRLYELICNSTAGAPTGTTIRQISRPALDFAFRTWRGTSPTATDVKEFAVDERSPFTFDVNPPVAAGTQVYAFVAVKPAAVAAASDTFGLADGYDIPAVDYVLYRLFSKDANDPAYASRASMHMQAYQLHMGIETKDASAE